MITVSSSTTRGSHMIALVISGLIVFGSVGAGIGTSQQPITWGIKASKKAYYPGEPVLLTVTFGNSGPQQEEVDFGADGIEAFSMEMHNSSGEIVSKGGPIRRYGLSYPGRVAVLPGEPAQKLIVLNQWCSTQSLPIGIYEVVCQIAYRLESECHVEPGTNIRKAGPFHPITLKLNIRIVQMDLQGLREVLEELKPRAFPEESSGATSMGEYRAAREMLVFAESALAVPYQLEVLATEPYTWLKRDAIN